MGLMCENRFVECVCRAHKEIAFLLDHRAHWPLNISSLWRALLCAAYIWSIYTLACIYTLLHHIPSELYRQESETRTTSGWVAAILQSTNTSPRPGRHVWHFNVFGWLCIWLLYIWNVYAYDAAGHWDLVTAKHHRCDASTHTELAYIVTKIACTTTHNSPSARVMWHSAQFAL